tara:strand:+ start:594 stop:779 length:186 start_codon:yes stop_codon:yes gene_type:complete
MDEKKMRDKLLYYSFKYKLDFITYEEMKRKIYEYEMNNFTDLVYAGKDKITKEYGYYLVSL